MSKYQIDFSKKAQKDLDKLTKNKKLLTKALDIVDEISEDPYSSNHKFEHLKHNSNVIPNSIGNPPPFHNKLRTTPKPLASPLHEGYFYHHSTTDPQSS